MILAHAVHKKNIKNVVELNSDCGNKMNKINVNEFFDHETSTLTYLVWDEITRDAVILDPLLDYDQASGVISEKSLRVIYQKIAELNLLPHLVIETHAHADHISGAQSIKKRYPQIKVAIGKNISVVQKVFKKIFNLSDLDVYPEQFDLLLDENHNVTAGSLVIKTIFTPGHTPACCSILIGDALFTGDTLFMPDSGTGRCDFPEGSARALYHSVHSKIYSLPDDTRIFVGHDYAPENRPLKFQSTIKEEKEKNIHIKTDTQENEYIEFREKRDTTLKAPRLLLPSIQINICAGNFSKAENNGVVYLKAPITFI